MLLEHLPPNELGERLSSQIAERYLHNFDFDSSFWKIINPEIDLCYEYLFSGKKIPKNFLFKVFDRINEVILSTGIIIFNNHYRSNTIMEEARNNYITVNMNTSKNSLTFSNISLFGRRSHIKVKYGKLHLLIHHHCISRYMIRDNKICSNFISEISDTLLMAYPLALSWATHKTEYASIVLPMANGLAFGYITKCNNNDRCDEFIKKYGGHGRGTIVSNSDNYIIVIKTYINSDSMNDRKFRLYLQFCAFMTKHKESLRTFFEDRYMNINCNYDFTKYSRIINDFHKIMDSREWLYNSIYERKSMVDVRMPEKLQQFPFDGSPNL